ncbi:MAG: iron ABC transporter substrate-binding protein, partial [Methylobacterium sp.]|nr:iron ABC transporter substrate-binding protein [Methylobacterium sp.]
MATRRSFALALFAATAIGGLAPSPAAAQGELVLYCSVQEEWCRPMAQAFERATGIKVAMTRKSSGETYAQ